MSDAPFVPVDRIGSLNGTQLFVMVNGEAASFESRSLPPSALSGAYHSFRSGQRLPPGWSLEVSTVAPWFGQPGGATQVFALDSLGRKVRVADLLRLGLL